LVEHPEEQEQLQQCLNHRLFSLVTWGGLVSLILVLQHKVKGRSRLLGCQVPCAAAASAAADGAKSSWLGSQLVCVGYTAAPEVLAYSTFPLEISLISCLFYSYVLEPLDQLLRCSVQQPEWEHAGSNGSGGGSIRGSDSSSGGSNPNSSSTSANNDTTGAGKVNSSSSSRSAGQASQPAKPSAAAAMASPAGSEAHGKGQWQGSLASDTEVKGILDFDLLPECPLVVQQLVDWLFAPGIEMLARPAAAALAARRVFSGSVEAEGEVVASVGAAGPVAPTAQHLGLVLELVLLTLPANDGSSDVMLRTEAQQQDQQEGGKDKMEKWGEGQQQQQQKQASCPPEELSWERALDCLLLLGALLQQATAAEKQQFLMEQGTLLLQLLYHLLLEEPMFEGEGEGEVHVPVYEGPWGQSLAEASPALVDRLAHLDAASYSVRKLVMLVFQALIFEPIRWSGAIAEALVGQARMVYTYAGGFGTCDIAGKMQEVAMFCYQLLSCLASWGVLAESVCCHVTPICV
jgi:hypothetical protein